MNQVYLSGIASEVTVISKGEGKPHHMQFMLSVRHKTAEEQRRVEKYPIHMWNRISDWAEEHVKAGDLLTVSGYLTNRSGIAVTAREILVGQGKGIAFPEKDGEPIPSNAQGEEK